MKRFQHGGNIYEEESPPGGWLDFSANINPLGLSGNVRKSILGHVEALVHYPDPEARKLKEAIAAHYELPYDEILLGNGAAELLYLFFSVMRFPRVLLPQPSFSDYERAALAAGSHVEYLFLSPGQDFRVPWGKLHDRLSASDCVVLGNPNNPTGNLVARENLEECLTRSGGRAWVLVDESFLEFREDADSFTVRHLVPQYPRLFVIHSMTKFYAMPGLRLGFGVAAPETARRLEASKDVWNVNLLAQAAGVAALGDTAYQENARRWLREELRYMTGALQELPGIKVFPSSVNFLLADVRGTGRSAADILAAMRERGILLRDCSNYPSLDGNYLRMAIRSHTDNRRLMDAWNEILRDDRKGRRA